MRRLIFVAFALGAVLVAGTASASRVPILPPSLGKVANGKLYMDGVLTVGQQTTIVVTKLLPKFKFIVSVAPRDSDPACGDGVNQFCGSERIYPVTGTHQFRTSAKGRAVVTFVVPSTFRVADLNPRPPTTQSFPFVNGESVEVRAFGARARHKSLEIGAAGATGVISVPPAPSS